jgi:hypothetical protein
MLTATAAATAMWAKRMRAQTAASDLEAKAAADPERPQFHLLPGKKLDERSERAYLLQRQVPHGFYYADKTAPDIIVHAMGGARVSMNAWKIDPISPNRLTTPAKTA